MYGVVVDAKAADDVGMAPQPAVYSLLDLKILNASWGIVRVFGDFIGSVLIRENGARSGHGQKSRPRRRHDTV